MGLRGRGLQEERNFRSRGVWDGRSCPFVGPNSGDANSSRWTHERGQKVEWQEGYGAFSVSASNLSVVERYIRNQAAHHRKMSFEEEFVALLRKHGVEFDAKFVFG